jgi:putative hydrolase of the HAD superfamily
MAPASRRSNRPARKRAEMASAGTTAFYIGRMGVYYARQLERFGFNDEVAAVKEAWKNGAADLLAAVRPRAAIVIVTNNLLDEQQDKLAYCGLAPLVDVLIASEDVGVAKPDRGIFTIALARAGVDAAEAVMIGDSWHNDIAGADAAGIAAIWFNPERKPRPEPRPGVREIHSLQPAAEIAGVILS